MFVYVSIVAMHILWAPTSFCCVLLQKGWGWFLPCTHSFRHSQIRSCRHIIRVSLQHTFIVFAQVAKFAPLPSAARICPVVWKVVADAAEGFALIVVALRTRTSVLVAITVPSSLKVSNMVLVFRCLSLSFSGLLCLSLSRYLSLWHFGRGGCALHCNFFQGSFLNLWQNTVMSCTFSMGQTCDEGSTGSCDKVLRSSLITRDQSNTFADHLDASADHSKARFDSIITARLW